MDSTGLNNWTLAARTRERLVELCEVAEEFSDVEVWYHARKVTLNDTTDGLCKDVYVAYVRTTENKSTLQAHLELCRARATRQHVFSEGALLTPLLEEN